MSMFDIQGGSGNFWNYSDQSKENYHESITGLVVEVSNPVAHKFGTNEVDKFEDGNVKRNFCMTIRGQSGQELQWIFRPGRTSAAVQAIIAALDPQNTGKQVNIGELCGKVVTVSTKAGAYNAMKPRPWKVELVSGLQIDGQVRGIVDLSKPQPPATFEVQPEDDGVYGTEDIPF